VNHLAPDWLDGETLSLAFLWTLIRQDGVVLGFTSHDRPIAANALVYQARPGMTPSAVTLEDGLDIDSMSISGALTANGLRGADLEAGRWHGAQVALSVCDWTAPDTCQLVLARGTIGEIVRQEFEDGGLFTVELLSPTATLARGGPPRCSALCRASLGDDVCQVDMESRHIEVAAASAREAALVLDEPLTNPDLFTNGTARILTGPLAGLDRPIAHASEAVVELLETVPDIDPVACMVRLSEGCDRRFETCVVRFGNALRFDGEPHLPGTDALVRYGES
jgi:uncharacterized phage protein (TIGR02218 family)